MTGERAVEGAVETPADRAGDAAVERPAEHVPLLVDVDTGIDDSLALLYACASPEADLLAVTCVAGNVEARQVAENTRAVLELAGRSEVEVALGREVPIARPLMTTPETHGPRGIGYAELPTARAPLSPRPGVDVLIDMARARPGEITLVTLGPVTNLAIALLREPELPRLFRRVVMMAGAYRSPGNTAPTSEWNVAVDPEAMKVVLTAFGTADSTRGDSDPGASPPPRPFALGLDVTERAKFTPEHLSRLARAAGENDPAKATNPVLRFMADALRFYMEFHSRFDGFYGAFIHDALALAFALDPTLGRAESLPVDVELGGSLTTGETVTDWRRRWGKPPNLDVVVEVDHERFLDRFIGRLGALAQRLQAEPGANGAKDLAAGQSRVAS